MKVRKEKLSIGPSPTTPSRFVIKSTIMARLTRTTQAEHFLTEPRGRAKDNTRTSHTNTEVASAVVLVSIEILMMLDIINLSTILINRIKLESTLT